MDDMASHDMRERFTGKGFDWPQGLIIVEICNSRFATAMIAADPRLALHLPCPIVVREDADGVEVSLLGATYVAGLFPEAEFGENPIGSESGTSAIVDAAVS
jgi:uncharacterized protein (DUF302 family)